MLGNKTKSNLSVIGILDHWLNKFRIATYPQIKKKPCFWLRTLWGKCSRPLLKYHLSVETLLSMKDNSRWTQTMRRS